MTNEYRSARYRYDRQTDREADRRGACRQSKGTPQQQGTLALQMQLRPKIDRYRMESKGKSIEIVRLRNRRLK